MQLKGEIGKSEPDAKLLYTATTLPLKGHLQIFPFMRLSMKVAAQLKKTQGIIKYAIKTDIPKKQFWTFSVWENRESMAHFVKQEPHATAVNRFWDWRAGEGGEAVEWTDVDRKVDWKDIEERLKNPSFSYKRPG